MKKIGIVVAMSVEIVAIRQAMPDAVEERLSGIRFFTGTIEGIPVVAARAGVGKVFAAMTAQTMILKYHPDVILNTGAAGYLSHGLPVGGIIIADRVVQHDMDTSAVGDPVGMISGINQVYLDCDPAMVSCLTVGASALGVAFERGTVATGDRFVSTREDSDRIRTLFGGIASEMEAGAIGQVCIVNKMPFAVVRGISDNGDENSGADYAANIKKAADSSAAVILDFIIRYNRGE